MRKLFAFLALSAVLSAVAIAAEPFRWTKVGGDPCNPKAGCTLVWALGETGWPQEVQSGLKAIVKSVAPETIAITSNPPWHGWMTWGKYHPRFEPYVVAAWSDGQYQPAAHWSLEKDDIKYHLIKVRKCGNWGGWTEFVPKPVIASPPPQKMVAPIHKAQPPPVAGKPHVEPMQLGQVPATVACNE